MSHSASTNSEKLQDSELLLLFAKQIRRNLGKLEPLHQYLLERSSMLQEQFEFRKIREIADSMLATTHALIDYLDKNPAPHEEISFSLRTSLSKSIQLFSHLFSEKQQTFEFNIPSSIPDTLLGSPTQLKRIVSLFFTQAFHYKGPIYGTIKADNDEHFLHFVLEIPDQALEETSDSQALEQFLYENLVKKIDAKTWIESQPSSFILHLKIPFKTSSILEELEEKRFNLSDKKILVLDSPLHSLQMLSKLIESWKVEVQYTAFPEEAKTMIAQAQTEHRAFDFVILEKELLGQNAFEWLNKLQTDKKNTSFILIASTPERGDASLCLQQGVQAYLTQPLHGIELWEVLQYLLNQNKAASPLLTRHVLLEKEKHFKILAFDPKEENHEKFLQLKIQGHSVHELKDWKDLLKPTNCDLILLDLESLEKDFKISDLRELHKNPRTPIVGLSKKNKTEKVEGIDTWLSSPLKEEEFSNLLGQSF